MHSLPLGETIRNLPDEEALNHILTNFPEVDCRMLSHIVERWGELSDELKRAVLAVVGSG